MINLTVLHLTIVETETLKKMIDNFSITAMMLVMPQGSVPFSSHQVFRQLLAEPDSQVNVVAMREQQNRPVTPEWLLAAEKLTVIEVVNDKRDT